MLRKIALLVMLLALTGIAHAGPEKHRQTQLYAAPVEFDSTVQHDGAVTHNSSVTYSDAVDYGTQVLSRTGRELLTPAGDSVAGATAGWVVTGADDGLARLPASQTSSTLVVPIKGLSVDDIVTGVRVIGQVESAGNNVTLVMSVRKATAVAGDFTDAEIGTANVGTLTEDTLISGTVLEVTGLTETLLETEYLYAVITGTTAASTDVAISSIVTTTTTK